MSEPGSRELEDFQDKVIWIAGASFGIGETLAHRFAADGMDGIEVGEGDECWRSAITSLKRRFGC